MNELHPFDAALRAEAPVLALAPMQDITDLRFLGMMPQYGGADIYWTEYFRVHAVSRLDKWILDSIIHNPTGRPIIAQMIGNDIPAMVRTVKELQQYPIAAIDLNLGCPAPVVYRKCAGGGLLRDPDRIDSILGALREAITTKFTVKTRVGFETADEFERLLQVFGKHSIDLLTVHARTVAQMYRLPVRYDLIRRASEVMTCPVIANGHVYSADQALEVIKETKVRGLMIGRGAIRNPWLFEQIRQRGRGEKVVLPIGRQVLTYIRQLWETVCTPDVSENAQAQRLKKFMNFLGEGVGTDGRFLHDIRRVATEADFFRVCESYLDHDQPMSLEPVIPDTANAYSAA